MSGKRGARLAALLAVLMLVGALLAACGSKEDLDKGSTTDGDGETPTVQPSPTTPPAVIEHPTGKDEFIILVTEEGGFAPPEAFLNRVPTFALLGNGCTVVAGPQIAIYPAPALPNLIERCLTEDGVQEVLRAAQDAGLLSGDGHLNMPGVADATTTVFTVNAAGKTTTVSAYALAIDPPAPGTPTVDAARTKLGEFLGKATNLSSWLPESAFADAEHPYGITSMQVVTLPSTGAMVELTPAATSDATPEGTPGVDPQHQTWPLDTPLATFGETYFLDGSRCATVTGTDLTTLLAALENANELTEWESNGEQYRLIVRPLLPGQAGCVSATS